MRRINNVTRNVQNTDLKLDSYMVTFDRSATGSLGLNRSTNTNVSNVNAVLPALNFSEQKFAGGGNVHSSTNIMYGAVVPTFNLLNPGSDTDTVASIRTVSGRSVNGTEDPFIDQGYEPVLSLIHI